MKVYVDTSIIGGCFDIEFQEWSLALFEECRQGVKTMMLSDLTIQELEPARDEVRNKINELPAEKKIILGVDDEAIRLAETYINKGALTNKSYNDALHIALATLNNADILASWNFKHIVNINKIRLYNSINLRLGYKMIEIRTPREILNTLNDGTE
ncbi:MAG: PIN domain-containing protein [Chitinophagaceae bacterium]|jgi:predicted nucleic acid-binding protein|nr:PIN domain-containing protein [Chitinophagaceae bacterium]